MQKHEHTWTKWPDRVGWSYCPNCPAFIEGEKVIMRMPDFTKAHVIPENVILEPNTTEVIYHLRPGGYLIGVCVNYLGSYGELTLVLQDCEGRDIENTTFHLGMAYTSCGIIFDKPLLNFSSRDTYRLKVTKYREDSPPIPNLTIYPIGCWELNQ